MRYVPNKNSVLLGIMASATAIVMGACLCGFILLVFSPSPTRHALVAAAIIGAMVGAVLLPLRFPRFNVVGWVQRIRAWRRGKRPAGEHKGYWPVKKTQKATVPGEVFLPDRTYKHKHPKDSVFVPFHDPKAASDE